jgi:hypothetical protein
MYEDMNTDRKPDLTWELAEPPVEVQKVICSLQPISLRDYSRFEDSLNDGLDMCNMNDQSATTVSMQA